MIVRATLKGTRFQGSLSGCFEEPYSERYGFQAVRNIEHQLYHDYLKDFFSFSF